MDKFVSYTLGQKPLIKRLSITLTLLVALSCSSFLVGYYARELFSSEYFQFPVLREVFKTISRNGLQPLPEKKLIEYAMIRGLIAAYDDPYTTFSEPPQTELQNDQLAGKFGGIGIRIEQTPDGDIRLYPLPGSPAINAGLLDGDFLLQVDDLLITNQTTLDQIQAEIRGPIGTKVRLFILRAAGLERKELRVPREEVAIPSVTYNIAPFDSTVGIIQLNIVAQGSATEIKQAITLLEEKGATRFILDLRNNGGGLIDATVEILALFTNSPDVILSQELKGETKTIYTFDKAGEFSDIELAVVVNQNTASAGEIIAGVLKAQSRAQIVGNRTFGKDSVQLVYNLRDGSSLHLTAGIWSIPGLDASIANQGIPLDVTLTDEDANNEQALIVAANLLH